MFERYGKKQTEEYNSGEPVEIPLGANRPRSLQEVIAEMVRVQISEQEDESYETLEESDDFEEEDPDTLDLSPYILQDIPDELPTLASLQEPAEQDRPGSEAAASSIETEPSASGDSSPEPATNPNPHD